MKNIIKFRFEGWFYSDVKRVIDSITDKNSIKNNLWLATAFIYVSSNEKRQKPCEFKQLMYKDIKHHANNLDDKLLGELLQKLKDEKIITVNESYSSNLHYAKHYAVSLRYKEYILDLFHAEQIVELKMSKKCFEAWDLLCKEDMFIILNDETKEETDIFKDLKENTYEEYEKSCIGYHQKETQVEELIKNRMLNNIHFDKHVISKHINNSGNEYRDISKVISFIRNTKNKTFTFKHGRLYLNGYTNGSKDFRDTFMYDDDELVELFDVKSCFILLTVLLAKYQNKISKEQLNKILRLVTEDDIYMNIAYYTFGEQVNKDKVKYRMKSKFNVIHWYFMNSRGKKCCGWSRQLKKVKEYLQTNFPEYYQFLITYKEIGNSGKKKSCLSIDCQWLENKLIINTLINKFKDYNVVSLHDSIWISKQQYSPELKKKVEQEWNKIIKNIIGDQNMENKQNSIGICPLTNTGLWNGVSKPIDQVTDKEIIEYLFELFKLDGLNMQYMNIDDYLEDGETVQFFRKNGLTKDSYDEYCMIFCSDDSPFDELCDELCVDEVYVFDDVWYSKEKGYFCE